MADKGCINRLQKEYKAILKEPVPNIAAHPHPSNILEWHYIIVGAEGTPYSGGIYYGKVMFPPQYPFKPPGINMFTPSGRFATNTRLCLSMSDYHPETWNPMWSVASILTGLMSFMYDEHQSTTGSITTSKAEKQGFAEKSLDYNVVKSPMFRKLFPEWVDEAKKREAQRKQDTEVAAALEGARAVGAGGGAAAGGGAGAGAAGAGVGVPQQGQKEASGGWSSFAVLAVLLAILAVPLLTLPS